MQIYQQRNGHQYENVTAEKHFVKARQSGGSLCEILRAICESFDKQRSLYIVLTKTEEEYFRDLFRGTAARLFPEKFVEQSVRRLVVHALELCIKEIQSEKSEINIMFTWLPWPCEKQDGSNDPWPICLTIAVQKKPERR